MNEHKELNRAAHCHGAVPGHEVNSPWLPASSDVKSWATVKLWDARWGEWDQEQTGRQRTWVKLCKWTHRVESKLQSLLPDSHWCGHCRNFSTALHIHLEIILWSFVSEYKILKTLFVTNSVFAILSHSSGSWNGCCQHVMHVCIFDIVHMSCHVHVSSLCCFQLLLLAWHYKTGALKELSDCQSCHIIFQLNILHLHFLFSCIVIQKYQLRIKIQFLQ